MDRDGRPRSDRSVIANRLPLQGGGLQAFLVDGVIVIDLGDNMGVHYIGKRRGWGVSERKTEKEIAHCERLFVTERYRRTFDPPVNPRSFSPLSHMRRPRIELGSKRWQRSIITTRPTALDVEKVGELGFGKNLQDNAHLQADRKKRGCGSGGQGTAEGLTCILRGAKRNLHPAGFEPART